MSWGQSVAYLFGTDKDLRGERAGIRTLDLLIKSQLLYRLSYALPRVSGQQKRTGPESARNICRRPCRVNPENRHFCDHLALFPAMPKR